MKNNLNVPIDLFWKSESIQCKVIISKCLEKLKRNLRIS
jgi:hypothetical protein